MDQELTTYLESFLTDERKERLVEVLNQRTKYLTVILEDLSNPQNANAIVRTLDCFGIQDLHVVENDYQFKPEKVTSKGSHKWININKHQHKENNIEQCLDEVKAKGYQIVATSPHTDKTIFDINYDKPVAFVFGNEHDGITDAVADRADELVKIPMYGFTESFNISVSVAMTLQEARNQIEKSDIDWQLTAEEKEEIYSHWVKQSVRKPDAIIKRYLEDKG